jgi:epsilon-lactone hydrolase
MPSEQFDATVAMLGATPRTPDTPLDQQRMMIDGLEFLLTPHDGTTTEDIDAGGVPARWVRPAEVDARSLGIVWLHGGGYNIGSPASHTAAASHLAAALRQPVLVVDYRLAPEHPFPAALDDADAAWRWLTAGVDPARCALVGDSAGGGLAVALTLRLRDARSALPGALALLCPWLDLTGRHPVPSARAAQDVVLSPELVQAWAAAYAGSTPSDDPSLSPLFADLAGLPPIYLDAGGRDLLLDDATRFAACATIAGVRVRLHVADEMIHAWHLFASAFPEAGESLAAAAHWITAELT